MLVLLFNLYHSVSANNGSEYRLAQLSWLTGSWLDYPKKDKVFETIWSPIRGSAMVGMTRVIWQGEMVYYESLTLMENGKGIFYRFDYFDKKQGYQLVDTNSFRLIKLEKRKATFVLVGGNDELVLEINADNQLQGSWFDKSKPESKPKIGYKLKKVSDL